MPSARPRSNVVALAAMRLIVPILFLLAFVLSAQVAQAATIPVTGLCTLVDAIQSANQDTTIGSCPAGSGADLIVLSAPLYSVPHTYDVDGPNATSNITGTIVISGGVAGSIIQRTGVDDARLFHVAATGNLTLVNVTLQNGRLPASYGGAIYNQGTVTLLNSVVYSNTAALFGGGIFNEQLATAIFTNTQFISNSASFGGGFASLEGSITTVSASQFLSNSASSGGGGFFNHGTATVSNSQFFSNTLGGGFLNNGLVTVTGSKLIANVDGGFGNAGGATAILTSTQILSNTSSSNGGGFYNSNHDTVILSDTLILGNTADNNGGGFNNAGTAILTNSRVISNTASSSGGGFYNTGTATLSNSRIVSNTAMSHGGGFYNWGTATFSNSRVVSNTAMSHGGGFYNYASATAILTNTQILSNTAIVDGGGFYNFATATTTLSDTDLIANSANNGGGFKNNGTVTLTGGSLRANQVTNRGGGFYNAGTVGLTGGELSANSAPRGGGFYTFGTVTITQVSILTNTATASGSAVYQDITGATTVNQSCVVNNGDVAVVRISGSTIDAQDNWWGAPDGPSGAGLGAGDSVGSGVDFTPFRTTTLLGCPLRAAEMDFSKRMSPSGNLLPGQSVTYTLALTNTGALTVHHAYVADALPASFVLDTLSADGAPHRQSGNTTIFTSTAPAQVVTVTLSGHVAADLNANLLLANTGSVTSSVLTLITDSVSANVVAPTVQWSSATYQSDEGSGAFTATVQLAPANPYASVSVQLLITDSALLAATSVQTLTFPPGSSSQTVTVADVDDQQILTRTVQLDLAAPSGAALGNLSQATLTFADDDAAQLSVAMSANVDQAQVGETITYSVRITNTGDVTFTTVSANADLQGTLAGLAGALAPGATRSAAVPYVVQIGEVGALVNTVTVTGTDALGGTVTRADSVTVTVTKPKTFLPVLKRH